MTRGSRLAVMVVLWLAWPLDGGVLDTLTVADIARALNIANASEAQRSQFHSRYIVPVAEPSVEQLEIITELRRFVLAAEEQLQAGNWMLGRGGLDQQGRSLKDLLQPARGKVSIRVRLRFHPLNAYAGLPPVDILLADPTLIAVNTARTPHVAPLATDEKTPREFIHGATIETSFDALTIANRTLPVRVLLDGKELVRVPVDFSRLD